MASTRIVDGREVPVAGKWVFDHDHTVLGFVARHMVFSKVRGRFNEFDGYISIGERLEDSSVELDIDASSLIAFTYEGIVPYPWGGDRAMFTAKTEVAREDWNVSWNAALETGGWLVSKAVDLEIEAQAILVEEGSDEEE